MFRTMKKVFSVLLSILLVCCTAPFATAAVTGGSCGDGVNWALQDGVLSITGQGEMETYSPSTDAPWTEYKDEITSLSVAGAVTKIGKYAFYDLENLTSVTLNTGLETIGQYAFAYCESLTELVLPSTLRNIESAAFRSGGLRKITFTGTSVASIGSSTFNGTNGVNGVRILVPEGFTVGGTAAEPGKTGAAPFYSNYVGFANGKATVV